MRGQLQNPNIPYPLRLFSLLSKPFHPPPGYLHTTSISIPTVRSSSFHLHTFISPPAYHQSPPSSQLHPSPAHLHSSASHISTCIPSPMIHHLLYSWSSANSSSAAPPSQSIPLPQYRTNTI
ncbi:hypothetical protein MKX03_017534 [Papaver bracteatum]|nr:hypothetical protein MKX03_017534 [Papaver bracteatum]